MREMSCRVRLWLRRGLAWGMPGALAMAICVPGPSLHAQAAPAHPADWHALSSVPCAGSVPLGGSGNPLDVPTTIDRLKAVGYKCYAMAITGHPPNTFEDFERLLPAAQAAGISVFAVLPSPADSGAAPFQDDYERWMRKLANLSLKFPVLRGVSIEELLVKGNQKVFTQEYLGRIYAAKERINPRFLFLPSVYDLDRPVADLLAGRVDGVWLWWANLDFANNMRGLLEDTRLAVAGRFPIYCGVYARWTPWHQQAAPWPRVFRRSLEIGCSRADGVIVWNIPLTVPLSLTDNPLQDVVQTFAVGGSSEHAGKCGLERESPGTKVERPKK